MRNKMDTTIIRNESSYDPSGSSASLGHLGENETTAKPQPTSINLMVMFFDNIKLIIYVIILVLIDMALSELCDLIGIKFPASVIGMILMYILLQVLRYYFPILIDEYFIQYCKEGIHFYKAWLPLFFYILLIPLAAHNIPNVITFLKIITILIIGFLQTLLFGAFFSKLLFKLFPQWIYDKTDTECTDTECTDTQDIDVNNYKIEWKYLLFFWFFLTVIFVLISFIIWNDTILLLYSFCLSIFTYILCDKMVSVKFKLYIPSALTFTTMTVCGIWMLCAIHGYYNIEYGLKRYFKSNKNIFLNINDCGAGDILKIFLGPSVINLSVILVEQTATISKSKWIIVVSVVCNFFVSTFFTTLLLFLLSLDYFYELTLITRQVTAPIAVEIAEMINADVSLTATFVVCSGSLGAIFAIPILNLMKIKNNVCRGIGGGCASHGLSTAAFIANEEDVSAAVSALALALMGVVASVVLSILPFTQFIKNMIH